MTAYIVAAYTPWGRQTFQACKEGLEGDWHLLSSKEELTESTLNEIRPEYVFFPHWSWRVPESIVENYECIAFHMTDLPYGRGGSPLQNLILRGHKSTKLTAFRMTPNLDDGPVYLKRDLSLCGTAEAIYLRAAEEINQMIGEIVNKKPTPQPQEGEVENFSRRSSDESRIDGVDGLDGLHNFIRMLDAEGYPRAFIECDGFRFEFSRSARYLNEVRATVTITKEAD